MPLQQIESALLTVLRCVKQAGPVPVLRNSSLVHGFCDAATLSHGLGAGSIVQEASQRTPSARPGACAL